MGGYCGSNFPIQTKRNSLRNPGTDSDRILLDAGEWLGSDSLNVRFENLDDYERIFSPKN